jgi:hypothetical protein
MQGISEGDGTMKREKRSLAFYAILTAAILAGAGVILLIALPIPLLALLPLPVSRVTGPGAPEAADTGPGGASDSFAQRTVLEAAQMIEDYFTDQDPSLDLDLSFALEEVPVAEAWERLYVQVFRITEGIRHNESFLIHGDRVLQMGTATGGLGLTSVEIADLDRDGMVELYFTYSFGSGIHQSRIGMYAPTYVEDRIYEAGIGYPGDLSLFREDLFTVRVRVVESEDESMTLHYLEPLGSLAIITRNGQAELQLRPDEDLPAYMRDKFVFLNEIPPATPTSTP